MSFGFPAYHTERYTAVDGADLRPSVEATLESLSWSLREQTDEEIIASTSINLSSWGERVVITFTPGNSLSITSKCALPTQCIDWGRNKRNVTKFLAALENAL